LEAGYLPRTCSFPSLPNPLASRAVPSESSCYFPFLTTSLAAGDNFSFDLLASQQPGSSLPNRPRTLTPRSPTPFPAFPLRPRRCFFRKFFFNPPPPFPKTFLNFHPRRRSKSKGSVFARFHLFQSRGPRSKVFDPHSPPRLGKRGFP